MIRIVLSHEHREAPLAGAWKALLDAIGQDRIVSWYSSDLRPEGGVGTGEWWKILHQRIHESDYLIAILTRESANRPWILWECGLARGREGTRGIIPVLFGFPAVDLHGPFAGFQSFQGDRPEDTIKLCRLLALSEGLELADDFLEAHVDAYLAAIRKHCEKDSVPRLFGSGFHRPDKTLEGDWDCTWYDDKGVVFERDRFHLMMEKDRVRIVGYGAKGYEYPMEGRLSCLRYMALSYWSLSHIATCGAVLFRINPTGAKMKGEWMGHTSKDYDEDDLHVLRGTVEATKVPVAAGVKLP